MDGSDDAHPSAPARRVENRTLYRASKIWRGRAVSGKVTFLKGKMGRDSLRVALVGDGKDLPYRLNVRAG